MAENSAISWTDHTFNPWIRCMKVGPGCDHCYAEAWDARGLQKGPTRWGAGAPRSRTSAANWQKPRHWNRAAERSGVRPWVFCASLADVFDNEVDPAWRSDLWTLVRETPALRWIFVTKRIGNAAKMLPADWTNAFGHCGLMSTIVNQAEADRDIPKLLATPAAWRGLSMEPLLGPVNLAWALGDPIGIASGFLWRGQFAPGMETLRRLDWIIVGGESGPGARPMHPDWARPLRDQCAAAGVPFHFKQWGEWGHSASVFDAFASNGMTLWPNGDQGHGSADRCGGPGVAMVKVGKKASGRLLDGVEHNGMQGRAA